MLPRHRVRGQGQITEIDAGKLHFSWDEAARFLNQVMSLDLTRDSIAVLERRTWARRRSAVVGGERNCARSGAA